MIYTVTLNPAIDYFVQLPEKLMMDEVNRGRNEVYKAGGKGLNVSKVLSLYGIKSVAVCLLGGFTGNYIFDSYKMDPMINILPVKVNGINRINIKASHGKRSLVINGTGPHADEKTKTDLLLCLERVQQGDYVILSGSMMQGLDREFLVLLCKTINASQAVLVLDMELKDLDLLRECRPHLIKPNLYELGLLLADDDVDKENAVEKSKRILAEGVDEVLISMGADGAMLINSGGAMKMDQPDTILVNKVGAGDAMLASYVGMRSKGLSREEALQYGGAAGNATAAKVDDITLQDIENYLQLITVRNLI